VRVLGTVLTVALTVAYPVVVFFGLVHFSARTVGLLALALAVPLMLLRFRNASREDLWVVMRVPLVVIALLGLGAALDDARLVMFMPVIISLALLVQFASSLRGEVTMIERFARMQESRSSSSQRSRTDAGGVAAERPGTPHVKEGSLSAAQIRHCRQVTVAWCVFFVVNAVIAGGLALAELTAAWAVYTGGIAYGLMGVMFAGERVVRHLRFERSRGHG